MSCSTRSRFASSTTCAEAIGLCRRHFSETDTELESVGEDVLGALILYKERKGIGPSRYCGSSFFELLSESFERMMAAHPIGVRNEVEGLFRASVSPRNDVFGKKTEVQTRCHIVLRLG